MKTYGLKTQKAYYQEMNYPKTSSEKLEERYKPFEGKSKDIRNSMKSVENKRRLRRTIKRNARREGKQIVNQEVLDNFINDDIHEEENEKIWFINHPEEIYYK